MKRAITLVATVATALALVPAPAGAAGDEEVQTVNGNVKFLSRFTDGSRGFPGLARRLWLVNQGTNGLFGYAFEIDPSARGGRFALKLIDDKTGEADLGVYLYSWFGNLEGVGVGTTGAANATSVAEYDAVGKGGEIGGIPEDAKLALVFMKNGLDANFEFKAFSSPQVDITSTGFSPADLTVQAGSTVVWTNVDEAFHGVTSHKAFTGEEGEEVPMFTSGTKATQPIGEGGTFKFRFTEAGTYTYFDRFTGATGSVTVTGSPGTPAA